MERKYSVYKITAPDGRYYIGYTSMSVKERWRYHKRNAADNRFSEHPFYRLVNEIGPDSFETETIAVFDDRYEAMAMEERLISIAPKELSLNLSAGGINDASEGGRIFWERLNADPEKKAAFLRKLSEVKKADDWTEVLPMSRTFLIKIGSILDIL